MKEWIVGRNPVYEVLRANRRQIFSLKISASAHERERLTEIIHLCSKQNVPVTRVPRSQLDSIAPNHQGVAIETSGYPYQTLPDILERATSLNEEPFILILDTLQDPQNLGTLLRSAEIVGVHGVLLPLRRTATVTPAVVSTSSGASEHILIAQANISQAIQRLKESGVWVIGLDGSPEASDPADIRLDGPAAFVIGSEGQGMRPLVRKSCDLLLKLPMRGRVESLNAAVAGSIALYLAWQARGFIKENQRIH
jgi:23S rRNA (guanosine2251-2'-O)-methyltransferase